MLDLCRPTRCNVENGPPVFNVEHGTRNPWIAGPPYTLNVNPVEN